MGNTSVAKPIEFLVSQRLISPAVAENLKGVWINNSNELYSRIEACEFAGQPTLVTSMESTLGVRQGGLSAFKESIRPYVDSAVVNSGKPIEHPLGLRLS